MSWLHPPPDWQEILNREGSRITGYLGRGEIDPAPGGHYEHWDRLRHRNPPEGLDSESWWALIRLQRQLASRRLPMRDLKDRPFEYVRTPTLEAALHRIDSRTTGRIATPDVHVNPDQRDRYLISSLIEESVTSSQLEGAATTRRVAVDMLRSGRRPRDDGERMIFNNFRAMEDIRRWQNEPLTPTRVLELHARVTTDTLDEPANAGRLQQPGEERIAVWDEHRNRVLYRPPPAEYLPQRLEAMCEFANQTWTDNNFIHPVIQAITLHFWLAWDHPFVDGNGRTARALFYWKMLNAGYWLFEFISISRVLKEKPGQYKRAFLETETDGNDLTYFILQQLGVIEEAVSELERYLERKNRELREVEQYLHRGTALNHRQLALLAHALRHPHASYTTSSHQRSHGVAYATARADLQELEQTGMLVHRPGTRRPREYLVPADLEARIRNQPANR